MTSQSTVMSRRSLLRGAGATVALPWLESLARAASRGDHRPPIRMAFVYVPNGMNMANWTPKQEGREFDLPATLKPLEPFRNRLTVLSGLTLNGARALGDGGGDHARSVAAYLTGAHPKKTDGADIHNGVSVDQVAAAQIGTQTPLASLELGIEPSAQAGRCDSGYSCVYVSNMAWRSPTSPVAKETNPPAVFDRMFGTERTKDATVAAHRRQLRKSVLDFVSADATRLRARLSGADRQKLDEYLYAVRDIEKRIDRTTSDSATNATQLGYQRPTGKPRDFAEHVRVMFDLMTLALQSNTTRIITFMLTNAGSNRSYPQIGVREGHHNLSHHGNDPEKLEKISKINHYHMTLFAYWIKKLNSIVEGDGKLLDNCMVMYGSGIGDGNRHNHDDLPIVLLGRGGGTVDAGRHVRYPRNTPLTNLYVSMLGRMGVPVEKFSDSNGRLTDLGKV